MTPWQVNNIYWHPRDEQGRVLVAGGLETMAISAERKAKQFEAGMKAKGKTAEEIDAEWVAMMDALAAGD